MPQVTLKVNGAAHTIDVPADMPLLWALREKLNLTGTKYACGIGQCGSCTVLVDGRALKSCTLPAAKMEGREITTIEGLSPDGRHPVQQAWLELDVPQCGYCQSGQILAATALLAKSPEPTESEIDQAMSEVLCRCGTYVRIRKAVRLAAEYAADKGGAA